jgi:hypothetical protein
MTIESLDRPSGPSTHSLFELYNFSGRLSIGYRRIIVKRLLKYPSQPLPWRDPGYLGWPRQMFFLARYFYFSLADSVRACCRMGTLGSAFFQRARKLSYAARALALAAVASAGGAEAACRTKARASPR